MSRQVLPAFLQEQLLAGYGQALFARIFDGFCSERVTCARVNTLKTDPESVRAALAQQGIETQAVAWSENALILRDCTAQRAMDSLPCKNGEIYLQSLSSQLPVLFLCPQPGENILDMAAAPGGKTTQIAAYTGGRAFITACEKDKIRAQRLTYNIEKQGVRGVTVLNRDARTLDPLFRFDRVLLDAPCTGSGTVDLNADRPPRLTADYLARTVKTQRALLDAALAHMRAGSEMIYSTCSILAQENDDVVRTALKAGKAELIPITAPEGVPTLPTGLDGTLCVCPDAHYEGFYVAKLRKR